ncbi:hypothetical protein ACLOJK_028184 [Asimina triloba]
MGSCLGSNCGYRWVAVLARLGPAAGEVRPSARCFEVSLLPAGRGSAMDAAAQIWIGMLPDGSLARRLGWSKSSWAIWVRWMIGWLLWRWATTC